MGPAVWSKRFLYNGRAVPYVFIVIDIMMNIIRHGNVHLIAGIAFL